MPFRVLRVGIAVAILLGLAPVRAGALELAGTFDTAGTARDVAFAGGLVYVADGSAGLRVLDVSSPATPVEIGALDLPTGTSIGVAVEGARAYLADGTFGLRIVDVTTPSAPSLLGEVLTGGSAEDVALAGGLAYVAAGFGGLVVVDVSNPLAPSVVGSVALAANARGVAVAGTRAYVAVDSGACLVVVDVSNPAAPSVVGPAFGIVTNCRGPEISGSSIFASFSAGLVHFDLSDPDLPAQLPPTLAGSSLLSLDVSGRLGFLATSTGARMFDLSGALAPPATLLGGTPSEGSGYAVALLGDFAYLANRNFDATVQAIDVSDPANPVPRGSVLPGSSFSGIDVASVGGQIRVYAAEAAALWVIDATDPDDLVPIGQEPLQDVGLALDVVGSLAYVGDGQALRILDVSNPTNPAPRGVLGTSGPVVDVQVVGNRAYLAEHDSFRLRIVDVSNPDLPLVLGSIVTQEDVGGVVVRDGLAYFTNALAGLRIFNVSNPASPVPLGQVVLNTATSTEYAQDVALVGKTAYVITSSSLWIIDVSDPSDPIVRTRADYENQPNEGGTSLVVAGGKAYVARLAGGMTSFDLAIWDVSSPGGLGPVEIASATGFAGGGGTAADLASGLVALAGGADGVRILDASEDLDAHPCLDGFDNDGDGLSDAADSGCSGGDDPSEERACHDGIDNDGDGLVDYPADPGCSGPAAQREDPQCQDGVDDDGDGAIDHPADSRCRSPWDDDELLDPPPKGCGLGAELALALVLLRVRRPARAA